MGDLYFNLGWFGRHPTVYEFASSFISPLRRKAARKMGNEKLKIIDIATGTGAHAYEMAKLGHNVTGIDLDVKMLAKAKKKLSRDLELSFLHADGTELPFADNEFDAATISFAMHDVPYEIGIKILNEVIRVIKDDGFIFIIDFNVPIDNIGARILFWVAQLYESPNYKPFALKGLDTYIETTGLTQIEKTSFLGAVQFTRLQRTMQQENDTVASESQEETHQPSPSLISEKLF